MQFTDLALAEPIVKAIAEQGYTSPTPIQAQGIPAVLSGRDLLAAAQTGTGKTAGFTLPILQKLLDAPKGVKPNQARVLVLTPTRELAAQVQDNVATYSKYTKIRSEVVFGGVKINPQMQRLRRGVDILVATPGRLLDLHNQNAIHFDQLDTLILDEADRMLDMGFINDIRKIMRLLPKKRQNLMFSATFSDKIRALAKTIVENPVEVSVTPKNTTAKKVRQSIIAVDKKQKINLLIDLLAKEKWHQVLVFSRTKHGANKIAKQLSDADIPAAAIHGNKSQGARTRALADFKSNDIQVLVATDIAARGIDIDQLPHVINFDLPNVAENYVHRIGRTARAGSDGDALSFVSIDEIDLLADIQNFIGEPIERLDYPGFAPSKPLPELKLNLKPKKIKKPKKPKQASTDSKAAPKQKKKPANKSASAKKAKTTANSKPKRQNRKPSDQKKSPIKRPSQSPN
ncbi:DEAD/DEAH box helicase [Bermanella marisrubri]|uniref:DEAD-box ATP-dependent RNA helicase RhpA n=1 Tax=Bermanella marisrubri TaxID=207949 RepID=Q1N6K9_9GAMM|nr:DEAD/DEAH box helicase [Bermanella marisrubri]EAT13583.1 DEAD/DEAH box helicase-like protein [Oceanobacter sp. RED65] [Bermanella marisrubri]QIZ84372.1 DEAD/DEAH box helicase [Bermanella marisrubri]